MGPVVIRNQGSETIWHPRRCDLPRGIVECEGTPCYLPCNQGRLCSRQQSVVPQDQRYPIGLQRSKPQQRGEAVGGLIGGAVVLALIVFGMPLALHFFWRT